MVRCIAAFEPKNSNKVAYFVKNAAECATFVVTKNIACYSVSNRKWHRARGDTYLWILEHFMRNTSSFTIGFYIGN